MSYCYEGYQGQDAPIAMPQTLLLLDFILELSSLDTPDVVVAAVFLIDFFFVPKFVIFECYVQDYFVYKDGTAF